MWQNSKFLQVKFIAQMKLSHAIEILRQMKRAGQQRVISESISLLIENGIQVNYSMRDASALRFESPDTAGELLDLWKKENEPEQMCVELFV